VGSITFTTTLVRRGPGVAVVLDDDQMAQVGEGAKRFAVAATINGETWRSTVVRMRGEFLLGLSREIRAQVGADAGEEVQVKLALDTVERTVEIPPALAVVLAGDPEAATAYDKLAYSHRKEFARWIEEAKRDETRDRRVAKALEMLRAGQTPS
jgi:hypothetical protein